MGISFKGHDNDWQYWVFDIDGRDWVAVNQSTPEPLKIQFQGRYSKWGGNPLSKEGGFDIVASTSRGPDKDGQNQGTVEWTWNGVRYKSGWTLIASNEIVAGDPAEGIEPIWDYQLGFVGRIAYDGPAGGAVGTGVTSQVTIEAAKNKEDRELAEATRQIVPSAQLSTAAPEQQYPLPMSVTSRPVTSGIATPTAIQAAQSGAMTKDEREALEAATTQISPSSQLSTAAPEQQYPLPASTKPVSTGIVSNAAIAQSNKTKEDIEASTAYKTPGYTQPVYASQVTPPATYTPASTGMTRMTTSPVIIPGTKDAREAAEAAAAAGTDWVKLGLQIGAAYLLFS